MKKRVMIYIEESDWKDIRFRALEVGISASRYLVNLYKADSQDSVKDLMARADKLVEGVDVDDAEPDLAERADKLVEGAEPEDLKKKLESVTKKIDHAIEVAEKKGVQANQDWRSDIKSRPKGQNGRKK